LVRVDPLADPAWMDLLDRSAAGMIFHHPAWLRLLHEHYGYSIAAWCLTDVDGRLAAGIPIALRSSRLTGARLVALPFSDFCPPLLDPAGSCELVGRLAAGAAQTSERFGLELELRAAVPADRRASVERDRYVRHRLGLQAGVEELVGGFANSSVLRNIARARREGLTVELHGDRGALARFYRLHTATRRRQGVPTQPRRFILAFSELFDQGLGFVLLVRHGQRDIAAAVFLRAGGTLTYKYGASDRRFLSLRPNNLLFMEAIRWGCEHGQRELDFGRTDCDNTGLRAFKSLWGAEESPLEYTRYGGRHHVGDSGIAGRSLRLAIRHAPPAFGRLVGEVLYRHFG
jgi:CelD/BcsL family acetyltransferase involved in cellulose biosynthesis